MGIGGKAIPSLVNKITDMKGDAEFVLLVEKDAAFMRLAEDRFYNQVCALCCYVLVTAGADNVLGVCSFLASL